MPSSPHKCGKCDARWYGVRIAHCSTCHNSFSNPANFDRHRVGSVEHRQCDFSKLSQNETGIWVQPMDESRLESLRQLREEAL